MRQPRRPLQLRRGVPLSPGKVYLFVSPKYRPGQVKIGSSAHECKRARTGKTWLTDITIAYEKCFLDDYSTEQALHREFAAWRVEDSEWFTCEVDVAKQAIDTMYTNEAAARAVVNSLYRQALEIGLIHSDLPSAPNTALEAIWSWRPTRSSPAVSELVQLAIAAGPAASDAVKALRKSGVIPCSVDGVCLFEFSQESRLTRFLNREVGQGRWEHQLKDVVGFTATGETVRIEDWRHNSKLDAASITRILSRGNNPQLLAANSHS